MSERKSGRTRSSTSRLLQIVNTCLCYGLDEFLDYAPGLHKLRVLTWVFPGRWQRSLDKPRAVRLRLALEELGPIFIKLGQLMSARPDLVPEDIATELTQLQDRVAPFDSRQAKRVIEKSLGKPLAELFQTFDDIPVASASVAQVHNAVLYEGKEVVVKVLRPGIEKTIERDLAVQYRLAAMARDHWSEGQRLRPVELVEDYDKTIHDELDLAREAANASQLRANFQDSELIYVPEVYWDYCARDVMVMERIDGISIREVEALKAAGIDMRKLSHNGVEIFFTQAFRDGFFHADMHAGNIFVAPDGQYRAVDFGIMGTLGESDKRYLAEMFLGFFNRDYQTIAEAHLRAGWVPPSTRAEEFEAAIRTVCEPIFAKPISEISFGRFAMRLFQTARRFNMPVQPQLVLLQKTLLQIEGLGRQLYPQLDLWETAKPFLDRWMNEQIGPRAVVKALRRELPKLGKLAPELPNMAHELMRRLRDEELTVRMQSEEINQLRRDIRKSHRRIFLAVVGGALIVSAAVITGLDGYAPTMTAGGPLWSWILGASGTAFLLSAWWKHS